MSKKRNKTNKPNPQKNLKTEHIVSGGTIILLISLLILFWIIDSDKSVNERIGLTQEWLQVAEKVATVTKDPEAQKIALFLKDNHVICNPKKDGTVKALTAGSNLAFLPLLAIDQKLSPIWQNYFQLSATASFNVNEDMRLPLIILRTDQQHSAWVGFTMLHEGYHVYKYLRRPYSLQSNKEFCYEELHAHQFENRLLMLWGKNKYKTILEKYVREIVTKNQHIFPGKINNLVLPDLEKMYYEPILDDIFGNAKSGFERNGRMSAFSIDTIFHAIDKLSKKENNDAKAWFLFQLYKERGILK